jgi:hypothetical protein
VRIHQTNRREEADHFEEDSDELPLTTTAEPNDEDPPQPAPPERMLKSTKLDLSKLQDMLQNEAVVRSLLPHISGTLKRLLAQCTAVVSSNDKPKSNPQPMQPARKIAPYAKLQLQLQPMKKVPKRKTAPPAFTGPTAAQRKELLNSLLPESGSQVQYSPPPTQKSKLNRKEKMVPDLKKATKPKASQQYKPTATIPITRLVPPSPNMIPPANQRTRYASFMPHLGASMNPTETIVRNGPHCLNFINLKSLEPVLSRGEQMTLKVWDKDFRAGWLYDEVINTFFWNMQEENPRLLFAPSTTMTAIMHGSSTWKLWSNKSIEEKDFVFIPWNPTGNHWVLFALDVERNALLYLDPLVNGNDKTISKGTTEAAEKLSSIFTKKFSAPRPNLEQATKTLQRDGSSCGVFVCFYGKQLASKKALTTPLETTRFRQEIYNQILGNCKAKSLESRNSCGICKDVDDRKYWVQCSRCQQWYHCSCVGVTYEEAQSMPSYNCKKY